MVLFLSRYLAISPSAPAPPAKYYGTIVRALRSQVRLKTYNTLNHAVYEFKTTG